MQGSSRRPGKPFDSLRGKPGIEKPLRKMHTIDTLTSAILASDPTAQEGATRAYVTHYIEMHGLNEAADRIMRRAEAAKKPVRTPRSTDKPVMIRDNYKGRAYYRRADASEIHDM